MYSHRATHGPVDLAFTDRFGGVSGVPFHELNLALGGADAPSSTAENVRRVLADFAPGARLADMEQVHGAAVTVVGDRSGPGQQLMNPGSADGELRISSHQVPQVSRPRCDALVTDQSEVVLMVRVADCVPVLLADSSARVIGAAHAGRAGMLAQVVAEAVASMRMLGASDITAWVGPSICGACYEVPSDLREAVSAVEPAALSTTSWGTPALDIGAGVHSQLKRNGVAHVVDWSRCTRESDDLYSFRRDGAGAGRFAGVIRLRA